MADSKRPAPAGTAVGRRTFSTAFRGYDQEEVKAYLEALAYEFRDLRDRIAELEGELEAERADKAEKAERGRDTPEAPKLDIATLTTALGEETARVLRTAQEAADDVRARAEEGAARTLKEAHDEAARVRAGAEGVMAERTAEAEQEVARIRREAQEETSRLRREATTEAEATVAKAVEQGRDMLSQAQAARERVLTDLARRRKVALNQIDQLRAGRERLHAKLHAARIDLERMMDDLARSDEEARLAEEAVGHVPAKSPAPLEESEAEEQAAAGAEAEAVEETPGEPASVPPAEGEEVGAVVAGAAAPETDDSGNAPATGDTATDDAVGDEDTSAERTMGGGVATAEAPATDEPPATGEPAAQGQAIDAPATEAPATEAIVVVATAATRPAEQGDDAADAEAAAESSSPESSPREAYRHDPVPAGLLPEAAVGAPEEGTTTGRVDELFARIRADRAEKVEAARVVLSDAEEAEPSAAPEPALEAPRSDQDESFLQRRDEALERPAATTVRAVRRGLSDDQNAALEHLRTARSGQVSLDGLLGDEAAHVARAAGWASPGLTASSRAASALAGGADAPLPTDVVARIAGRMATGLIGPVRQRMAELLDDAGADHGPDTADRINGVYREARARIDLLVGDAVTEVVSSAFASQLGEGTPVRWVVEDVDGPCPDCDDNALAGPTPLGQAFPTGQTAPPAHPGCRCVLAPTPA